MEESPSGYGSALEMRRVETPREFESHLFRQIPTLEHNMRHQLREDINAISPVSVVSLVDINKLFEAERALINELLKEATFVEGGVLGAELRLLKKLEDRIVSLSS